jgi:hypothetical protein
VVYGEAIGFRDGRIGLDLVALLAIEGEVEVARLFELAAIADQIFQLLPQSLRAQGQRILSGESALKPQIAKIGAARLSSDDALLDDDDALVAPGQEIGRPGPDQAAANDGDIDRETAHEIASTAARAIGLTGACTRNRPAAAPVIPAWQATISCNAGPQTRP